MRRLTSAGTCLAEAKDLGGKVIGKAREWGEQVLGKAKDLGQKVWGKSPAARWQAPSGWPTR